MKDWPVIFWDTQPRVNHRSLMTTLVGLKLETTSTGILFGYLHLRFKSMAEMAFYLIMVGELVKKGMFNSSLIIFLKDLGSGSPPFNQH